MAISTPHTVTQYAALSEEVPDLQDEMAAAGSQAKT